MTGWGSGPWGSSPWGTGLGVFGVASAEQVAINEVRVTFTQAVEATDPATYWDALNPVNWTIEARDPYGIATRIVRRVDSESASSVLLFLDGPLDGPDATYRVYASALIVAADGAPIDINSRDADFLTFGFTVETRRVQPTQQPLDPVDVANPQTQTWAPGPTSPLNTLQVTDTGDYGNEKGTAYLAKRLIRRATTQPGGFPLYGQGYGFLPPLKGVVRNDDLLRVQANALAQCRQEPDVVDVSVKATRSATDPQTIMLAIAAKDRYGQSVNLTVPVQLGSLYSR